MDSSSGDTAAGCDEACDPDFAITHITAPNLFAQRVHLFGTGNGTCEGARCPADFIDVIFEEETIVPCSESAEAIDSPLGAAEYCRIAPFTTTFGFDIGFATPVD